MLITEVKAINNIPQNENFTRSWNFHARLAEPAQNVSTIGQKTQYFWNTVTFTSNISEENDQLSKTLIIKSQLS